eukprot:6883872-Prymnesium_polylepis.1
MASPNTLENMQAETQLEAIARRYLGTSTGFETLLDSDVDTLCAGLASAEELTLTECAAEAALAVVSSLCS